MVLAQRLGFCRMSLHGYTGAGGPVGYVQPSTSYQYSQPSHASLYDPNAFRQFYTAQLTALTFNSRHIIQNLSMIAQEYVRMSDIVVQCIETHIRRVSFSHASCERSYSLRLSCGMICLDTRGNIKQCTRFYIS